MRTLPLTLRPARAVRESFAGYVDRLAAHLDVPLMALLHRTGLIGKQRFSALPVGYGVCLSPGTLRAFAGVARMPDAWVRDMLLESYGGVCWDASSLDPSSPDTVRRAALGSWAYFVGSHACPKCLEEHGTWRLRWKLPWSFACPEHGVLLVDTCPGCGRRMAAGRRDGRTAPAFASLVPAPTACRNALPRGAASPGRSARPCGHDLRSIGSEDVAGSRLVEAQRRLDAAMAGRASFVAGEPVAPIAYFRDMRSLCALLLAYAEVDDLGELPESALHAFRRHAQERSDLRKRRQVLAEDGGDWRAGPRHRPYTGPPESAALMAALCARASEMLDADGTVALARAFEPFVERAWALDPRGQVPQRFAYFGFTCKLSEAFELCWSPRRKLTARLGTGRDGVPVGDLRGITADRVPQLFWEGEFEGRLANMLPGVSPRYARRVCSMWLVRAAEGCTWEEAASALGVPSGSGRAMANKVVSLLSAHGHAEWFDSTLREVVCGFSDRRMLIDYGARRRAFSGFEEVEWEEWRTMCRSVGVHPGKRGGRQRQAAAWLWARIAGGDHLLSPSFLERDSECEREAYRRFVKHILPALEVPLQGFGQRLVDRHAKNSQVTVRKTAMK